MARITVDRGSILEGMNKTVRDSRVPHNIPRSIVNYRIPDGRARRRPGFSKYTTERIKGVQLAKHTPTIVDTEAEPSLTKRALITKSPLSYGLLKWHSDFQPVTTHGWTIEFILTLGDLENLVQNPYTRYSSASYTGASRVPLRETVGVYVLDQTVVSNAHLFKYAGNNETTAATKNDTFGLSALSIQYTKTHIKVSGTTITAGRYNQGQMYLQVPIPYVVGGSVHVAVVFDPNFAPFGTVYLFLNGTAYAAYFLSSGEKFAGEEDAINGNTSVVQRDIVLLNENIVRGNYASACRPVKDAVGVISAHGYNIYNTQINDNTQADSITPPWCMSPPRGTGISELRYWNVAKSQAEMPLLAFRTVTPSATNLVGYWRLNDGGPACIDLTDNGRHISVHHGYPAYLVDKTLLGGMGIQLADGQHIKKEYTKDSYLYQEDSHKHLRTIFEAPTSGDDFQERHCFTTQIQIKTPYTFQQEINTVSGSPTITSTKGDVRQKPAVSNYTLYDGGSLTGGAPTVKIIKPDAGTATTAALRFHRAYDSTLWSIEAQATLDDTNDTNNDPYRRRVALARGLLTPAGKVAFEVFLYNETDAGGREFRVVSNTTLSPGTAYSLTFRKRILYYLTGGVPTPYGVGLAIFINDSAVADAELTISRGVGPAVDLSTAGTTSFAMKHGGVTDVLIGSSYVRDSFDRSIRTAGADPIAVYASVAFEQYAVGQRFMSPYQDQPGFFTLGMFRFWSVALSNDDVLKTAESSVDGMGSWNSLVYSLVVEKVSGTVLTSRTQFSTVFNLSYKGWGSNVPYTTSPNDDEAIRGTFALEDRLGYDKVAPNLIDLVFYSDGKCNGLSYLSKTLSGEFGYLFSFSDSLFYNQDTTTGAIGQVRFQGHGLMADFSPGCNWKGVAIGDRTLLLSRGGVPKMFNGRIATTAGFREWNGGQIDVDTAVTAGATLTFNKWFGVRVIYFAEDWSLYHVSPQTAVRTTGATNSVVVSNIAPHPDPRITSIIIAVTDEQVSRSLALVVPPRPVLEGPIENKFTKSFVVSIPSTISPLVVTDTPFPVCAYGCSANGRAYLTGDELVKDIVYFTSAGNPEQINTLVSRIVTEEASGDDPVGIEEMFGSIYQLKPNAIWKIDEISPGSHQIQKASPVGPISEKAYSLIVIPDNGRIVLVFWSHHGPYFFDGINPRYIGFGIEGQEPYDWLDQTSVYIVHDARRREVQFCYKSRDALTGKVVDRHDRSIVYNYRDDKLYSYDGVVGSVSLSMSFTKDTTRTSSKKQVPSGTNQPTLQSYSPLIELSRNYIALVGADNGAIYQWGSQDYDGIDFTRTGSKFEISNVLPGNVILLSNVSNVWGISEFKGLWVTIVKRNFSDWMTVPILENSVNGLVLDTRYKELKFTPEVKDFIYLGFSPATIEFPWDIMDKPYYDKTIHRATIWYDEDLLFRYSRNWDLSTISSWEFTPGTSGRREHVPFPNVTAEALKLELASFEPKSEVDAYAYQVTFHGEANVSQ